MSDTNKMITYFHIRALSAQQKTATAILDAAKSATDGKPELLADYMFLLATAWRVKITKELEQYRQDTTAAKEAAETAKQKTAQIQTATDIQKQLETFTAATEAGDSVTAQTAADTAARLGADLKTKPAERARIITFDTYRHDIKTQNDSADFAPMVFRNVKFPTGTISLIGARTSRGKTTALINLAREAIDTGRKTIYITLEEGHKKIFTRLILSSLRGSLIRSGIALERINPRNDHYKLEKGLAIDSENNTAKTFIEYRNAAVEEIEAATKSGLFMLYDGRTVNTAETITNAITAYADKGALVLLDYIQKMPPTQGGNTDTYRRVTDISHAVLAATVRSDSITICGAQFHRGNNNKPATDKNGADLFDDTSFRESGDLEQDAEIAIGLGREADKRRFYEILKYREGEAGDQFYLDFDGAFSYMSGAAMQKREPIQIATQEEKALKQEKAILVKELNDKRLNLPDAERKAKWARVNEITAKLSGSKPKPKQSIFDDDEPEPF